MRRICAMLLAMLMLLTACAKPATYQEQYDLGVRYLSEGRYEEAVLAFTAAIEIDPTQEAAYVSMAEAYWAQGEDDLALEILNRGYQATNSPRLLRFLNAEEANQQLGKAGRLESLAELMRALQQRDMETATACLGQWVSASFPVDDPNAWHSESGLYGGLFFDGQRFYGEGEGPGLLFSEICTLDAPTLYYGPQENGLPQGEGVLIAVAGLYMDGSIFTYWVEGTWEQGVITGEARIGFADTPGQSEDRSCPETKITCTFGEREIMTSAEVTESWTTEGVPHRYTYHVVDGKLLPEEWPEVDPYTPNTIGRPCDLHGIDCLTLIETDQFGNELYCMPYPWTNEIALADWGEDQWRYAVWQYSVQMSYVQFGPGWLNDRITR